LARLASDDGQRTSMSDLFASLGVNREDLEAELESEISAGKH
jgi:hypothetical protein